MAGEHRALEGPDLAVVADERNVGIQVVQVLVQARLVLLGVGVVVLGLVVQGLVTLQADGRVVVLHREEVLGHVVDHGLNHILLGGGTLCGTHLGAVLHVIDDGVGIQAAGHVHITGNGVVEGEALHAGQRLGFLHIGQGGQILVFDGGGPAGPHLQGGVHHVFGLVTAVLVDVHVLTGGAVPLGTVEGLQLANFNGRAVGLAHIFRTGDGIVVDGVLLEVDALGPGRQGTVFILPAVQGHVLAHRLHIIRVEVVQGHTHAPHALAADSADVQHHLHLLAPAFGGQAVVGDGNSLNVIVYHKVVVVLDSFAVHTHVGQLGPVVVEHHNTAGVIVGVVTVGGHIGSGLRESVAVQVHDNHFLRNLGNLGASTAGHIFLYLVAIGLEVRVGFQDRLAIVVPAAAAAGAAPRHAELAAVSAAGAVLVLHTGDQVILNFISLVQHIAFGLYAAVVHVHVTERMVVFLVVHHNVGGIRTHVLVVVQAYFLVFPAITPLHVHVAGLAEFTAGNLIQGKVVHDGLLHFVRGCLGVGLLGLVVNAHLAGVLALEQDAHHAEGLGLFAVRGGDHLGIHLLGDYILLAVGAAVLDVNGLRTQRNGYVSYCIVTGGDSFGEHVGSFNNLHICRNGVQHAGHGHKGQCRCQN